MSVVAINGIFRSQSLSGQQRYATEMVARLAPGTFRVVEPRRSLPSSSVARHAWTNARYAGRSLPDRLFLTHQYPWARGRARTEVLTIHDLFPLTDPQWYQGMYGRYAARLLARGITRADILIAVSDVTAQQIRSVCSPRGEIHVIPGGPVRAFFAPPATGDATVLAGYGLSPGDYLVTMASGDPRKRLDLIIAGHAMSSAVALPLVVAGTAPDVVQESSSLTRSGVITTGRISDDELAVLYRNAALFVTASDAEGFGLPVVEAATAGARVLASDLPIHRWSVGGYGTFFERGSAEALSDGIDRALDSEAHPAYDRRFDFDRSAAQLGALLADL